MTEPQKPMSDRKAEELEEKEAPRRASVFGEEGGDIRELEEKEAPRAGGINVE